MRSKKHQPSGYMHLDHPKPITRRQLMAQGFLGSSGAILAPGILSMFSQRALGADASTTLVCTPTATGGRMVPVLIFDLAGGGNIAGSNVIVGGKGGQSDILPAGSYSTIGLTAAQEPAAAGVTVNKEYGLAFHPNSPMLAGMNSVTTAATRANVEGVLFCAQSNDDTGNNPHSPLYWLAKGGLTGSLVSLVGSNASASGGNSAAPASSIDPSKQPSRITRPSDGSGLVSPGKLATILGAGGAADAAGVKKVMDAIKMMSDAKVAQFNAQDVPTQVQDLIRCGYINSSQYLSKFTPAALDATQDAMVKALYPQIGTDAGQNTGGTIAKLVLDGYAGAGVVSLGGYDYHGQSRAATGAKDNNAGVMIGRALELAAQKKTPVMIYVYTDGGVSSAGGGNWAGDSGQRSATFALVYNPTAKTPTRNNNRQIGAYTAAGAVDKTAAVIGDNVQTLSIALAANWLALHGREGDLAKVAGSNPFGADLEKYLAFMKLT